MAIPGFSACDPPVILIRRTSNHILSYFASAFGIVAPNNVPLARNARNAATPPFVTTMLFEHALSSRRMLAGSDSAPRPVAFDMHQRAAPWLPKAAHEAARSLPWVKQQPTTERFAAQTGPCTPVGHQPQAGCTRRTASSAEEASLRPPPELQSPTRLAAQVRPSHPRRFLSPAPAPSVNARVPADPPEEARWHDFAVDALNELLSSQPPSTALPAPPTRQSTTRTSAVWKDASSWCDLGHGSCYPTDPSSDAVLSRQPTQEAPLEAPLSAKAHTPPPIWDGTTRQREVTADNGVGVSVTGVRSMDCALCGHRVRAETDSCSCNTP